MKNKKTIAKAIALTAFLSLQLNAQTVRTYQLQELLADNKLEITIGKRLIGSVDSDKPAITLNIIEQIAWLKTVNFQNGEIELDLKGKDALQNSFLGIAFHGLNDSVYDAVYFRPFNFQATDSVRHIHAVQYISSPDYHWERLRREHNAQYEKAIVPAPDPNTWFHARIIVSHSKVKVYVNHNSTPSLEVDKLNHRDAGKIGLWLNGDFASFANLKITDY
ncbi:MAG: DUF1080 domain-containing protein [Paludibacter sp.]